MRDWIEKDLSFLLLKRGGFIEERKMIFYEKNRKRNEF